MKMRHRPRVKRAMDFKAQACRYVQSKLREQQQRIHAMWKWAKERQS